MPPPDSLTRDASSQAIVGAAVLATVSTVLPGFLVGALSVQVSEEFDVSEARYGLALASFFLAATAGSAVLGRLAQQVGPRRQVTAALTVSAAVALAIAASTPTFMHFVALLAVAGLSNSGNQSAINLLLTQAKIDRLGLALAIKQSAMPAASLLGGLAVPAVAVTVGWRWAYVLGAAMAIGALIAVRRTIAPMGRIERRVVEPVTPARSLRVAAVGFACLAFGAGALNAWTVASAVDAGVSPGLAGLLLSLGAGCGIAVRLLLGFRLDVMTRSPLALAALLCTVGAAGIALLMIRSPMMAVVATVVAFGTGWVWPVLTNYAIVRANQEAAARATGLTQTGVYIGVFAGPLVTGAVIEAQGYSIMWAFTAAVMAVGAAIVVRVSL